MKKHENMKNEKKTKHDKQNDVWNDEKWRWNNDKKNDECNDNQNYKIQKHILTWPSLWLQVFHNCRTK